MCMGEKYKLKTFLFFFFFENFVDCEQAQILVPTPFPLELGPEAHTAALTQLFEVDGFLGLELRDFCFQSCIRVWCYFKG